MRILSSEFEDSQHIPEKYTCQGEDINPPLSFMEIPHVAKSLVLVVDDPDAPTQTFVHWLVFNIDPTTPDVEEGSIPDDGMQGKNSAGSNGYVPPCPPSGTHRYFFKLYALDDDLLLDETAEKEEVEEAMEGHVIDEATLIGLYEKE